MDGMAVTLVTRAEAGVDGFNMPVYEEASETVEDCLVCPGSTRDLDESRPEGAEVAYTVVWPKAFTGSIKGAQVIIPDVDEDERFDVVGDPRPVPHNCPTRWNRISEVGHVAG